MVLKYNIEIDNKAIQNNLMAIINKTYKLLPSREEGLDWEKPLSTLIEELGGMNRLFIDQQEAIFFKLLCKLEGLFILTETEDFSLYRRTIFECLSLMNTLLKNVGSE